MLLLATFFPATEAEDAETNDDIVTVSDYNLCSVILVNFKPRPGSVLQ